MSIRDDDFNNDAPVTDLGELMKEISKAKNDPNYQKEFIQKIETERAAKENAPGITEKMKFPTPSEIVKDYSFWFLLISNIVAIYFINKNNISVAEVMMIYWAQSVIIGIVNLFRILMLKDFSTKGLEIGGQPAVATEKTKINTALFFAFHYGLFHLVYLLFIVQGKWNDSVGIGWLSVLSFASVFFLNHFFSFFYNRKEETEKRNIGSVMFSPYKRIIPMHLAIIFGSQFAVSWFALNLFLLLKVCIDLLSHVIKHEKVIKSATGETVIV